MSFDTSNGGPGGHGPPQFRSGERGAKGPCHPLFHTAALSSTINRSWFVFHSWAEIHDCKCVRVHVCTSSTFASGSTTSMVISHIANLYERTKKLASLHFDRFLHILMVIIGISYWFLSAQRMQAVKYIHRMRWYTMYVGCANIHVMWRSIIYCFYGFHTSDQ